MEWDESKSEENRLKRGFGFEIALHFDWDTAVYQPDVRWDYGEDRIVAFGWAVAVRYAIVFTHRNGTRRIISIRRMHDKEARKYGI